MTRTALIYRFLAYCFFSSNDWLKNLLWCHNNSRTKWIPPRCGIRFLSIFVLILSSFLRFIWMSTPNIYKNMCIQIWAMIAMCHLHTSTNPSMNFGKGQKSLYVLIVHDSFCSANAQVMRWENHSFTYIQHFG